MGWQRAQRLDPYLAYDRYEFPGYDAYAYLAAAEHPFRFTVAPWGHRILTPWTVRAVGGRNLVRGFQRVTVAALALAGLLLFLYFRELGHTPLLALFGVLAFALSGPVGEVAGYPFLAEPLTLLVEVAFLLAVARGSGPGSLALLAVLGVSSKEFFVLLLPLVWLGRRSTVGDRRALMLLAQVAVPAVVSLCALRLLWQPHLSLPLPVPGLAALALGLQRATSSFREWAPSLLLGGLAPLALLGFSLPFSRGTRIVAAYLAAVSVLPPFFNPVAFFPWDIPRLLIYLLPGVIALALFPLAWLGRRVRRDIPSGPPSRVAVVVPGSRAQLFLWAAALLLGLVPALLVDRYRRVDLSARRDGPQLLALCRETNRTAARLARGIEVRLDPEDREFVWGESDPAHLGRMRWFLRDGFGTQAHYGRGPAVVERWPATLLLPVTVPAPLEIEATWQSPTAGLVEVQVNGRHVGVFPSGPETQEVRIAVPSDTLFRGDNQVTLASAVASLRLRRLAYRP